MVNIVKDSIAFGRVYNSTFGVVCIKDVKIYDGSVDSDYVRIQAVSPQCGWNLGYGK